MADILLIVEGEKQEKSLMDHLIAIYIGSDAPKYNIWAYKTCIYDLYDKVFENCDNDAIDLLLTLKAREKDINIKRIFDMDYSDIILIFDFDPHDNRYDKKKILRMQEYFNDSTENGKLYINYPMVEAFKHTERKVGCSQFIGSTICSTSLSNYKQLVNTEGKYSDYALYDKELCNKIIEENIKQGKCILGHKYNDEITKEEYEDIDLLKILQKQTVFLEQTQSFHILCTCVFYIIDYNYNLIVN